MPSLEEEVKMYTLAHSYLCDYYLHYEVSSYAKGRYRTSRHNRAYWSGFEEFFGFGMGATSLVGGIRMTRAKSLKKYFEWVQNVCRGVDPEI